MDRCKGLQKNFRKSLARIVLVSDFWLYLLYNLKTNSMNLLESTHEALKQKLARGVVQFAFKKLDGSLRTAVGTTNLSNVPVDHHPKGVREASSKVTVYFDIEKKEWRSVSKRVEVFIA